MLALFSWVALLFIFTFHNFIKALTAVKLGDETPKRMGFLTFNPLVHIDLFGTVLVPLLFLLTGSKFLIGWPRYVPINYSAFKNGTRDILILTAISILTYFALGFLGLILYKAIGAVPLPENVTVPLESVFQFVFVIGVFFGFLNLIPIPPLDMGVILLLLLGKDIYEIQNYSFWGMLLVLLLFLSGILTLLFKPIWLFLSQFI